MSEKIIEPKQRWGDIEVPVDSDSEKPDQKWGDIEVPVDPDLESIEEPAQKPIANPATYKKVQCKYFNNGKCKFGRDCTFAHNLEAKRKYQRQQASKDKRKPKASTDRQKTGQVLPKAGHQKRTPKPFQSNTGKIVEGVSFLAALKRTTKQIVVEEQTMVIVEQPNRTIKPNPVKDRKCLKRSTSAPLLTQEPDESIQTTPVRAIIYRCADCGNQGPWSILEWSEVDNHNLTTWYQGPICPECFYASQPVVE